MTNIPLLFLFPVHVVLLELIIDPTCSIVLGLGIVLYTPLSSFLKLAPLSFYEMIVVIIISIVSVMWYDCKIIILPI